LAILKPRRLLTSWSNVAGNIYKASFDYGHVSAVTSDGEELDEASSTSVSSDEFYYDYENEELYIDVGANPSTVTIVATYELYIGTFDANWYRLPLDNTSRQVYFDPLIVKSPTISCLTDDSIFGISPVSSSSLVCSNVTHFFQYHLYDSSFNLAEIDIYHWVDELKVANLKLVYRGLINNISMTDNQVTFNVFDRNADLDIEFRNPDKSYFDVTTFANIDPIYENRPIRTIFGKTYGIVPINIDYEEDSPSQTNNRDFVVKAFPNSGTGTDAGTITATVQAGSTTTVTYVDDASGFGTWDFIVIDNGSTYYTTKISAVSMITNTIVHDAIGSPAPAGYTVTRYFVSSLYIKQAGVIYEIYPHDDWDVFYNSTDKVVGFSLHDNMETSVAGLNTFDPINDKIWCHATGDKNDQTIGGSPWGDDYQYTGSLANASMVIYKLLKDYANVPESRIDTDSFDNIYTSGSFDPAISLNVPETTLNDFPLVKDLITKVLQSSFMKLIINDDNKWELIEIKQIGSTTADYSIEDDEILKSSFDYKFDYSDLISTVFVNSNKREISTIGEPSDQSFIHKVSVTSENALYLHKKTKQLTFNLYLHNLTDSTTFAERMADILGERFGKLTIRTKNRLRTSNIGDIIDVTRSRLPGFAYDKDEQRTDKYKIVSISKSFDSIQIELDDQEGIEQNRSGGF
jgi:hypothetical protein